MNFKDNYNIAIVGLGNVGSEVYRHLVKNKRIIEINTNSTYQIKYISAKKINVKKVHQYLSKFYKNSNFVKILPYGKFVNTNNVNNTNDCNINIYPGRYKNQLIIVSSIDNLVKGAAGQAVQNMNIRLGLKESLGLK